MTKWLLLVSILFWALLADAQTFVDPCTGAAVSGPATITPVVLPMTCSQEKGRDWGVSLQGVLGWTYCLDTTKKTYSAFIAVATRQEVFEVPGLAEALFRAGPSADMTTINRLGAKYVPLLGKFSDAAHAAVWCPYRARIAAGTPLPPAPAPAIWLTTSTVIYRLNETNTALGAQVPGSVTRGVQVDGTKAVRVGSMHYCPWIGGPPPFKTYVRCAEQKIATTP